MNAKDIQTEGKQLFNIPNDEAGQEFVKQLRKYLNPRYKFRLRGRGTRKEAGDGSYVPLSYAEWFAAYFEGVNLQELREDNRRYFEEAQKWKERAADANKRINELQESNVRLMNEVGDAEAEVVSLKEQIDNESLYKNEARQMVLDLQQKLSDAETKLAEMRFKTATQQLDEIKLSNAEREKSIIEHQRKLAKLVKLVKNETQSDETQSDDVTIVVSGLEITIKKK